MLNLFLTTFLEILLMIIFLLISVAYITLLERKVLAVIQRRKGPNVIGIFGLLQPLSDGFKLLIKETVIPSNANKFIFLIAPVTSFLISLLGWGVIPFSSMSVIADINCSVLYLLSVSSLGVYGIILSGWSSNSKYAFLGALRSAAQMISYELPIGFTIITVCLCVGSFNFLDIIDSQKTIWYIFPMLIPALVFFISGLAETNRHPFDLPEAEAELVSGYNVEYSSMTFALFSLAEYSNILLMCSLNSTFFFGGFLAPKDILSVFFPFFLYLGYDGYIGIKTVFFAILFIYIRAILPRYRYDQLMHLGWKLLLPISLSYLILTICIIYGFDIFPHYNF